MTFDEFKQLKDDISIIKLRHCPFCGGHAEILIGLGEYWAHCVICTASTKMENSYYHASEAWNRRYKP